MQKFIVAVLLSLPVYLHAQELPDTPSAVQPPATKCGPWNCYQLQTIPTKDVFKSKAYWTFVGIDFAVSTFDAAMSYQYQGGNCVEGGDRLGTRPSLGALMRHNLPENAATAVVGFIWIKVKGPKWVMPMMLAYPAQDHLRAGLAWRNFG